MILIIISQFQNFLIVTKIRGFILNSSFVTFIILLLITVSTVPIFFNFYCHLLALKLISFLNHLIINFEHLIFSINLHSIAEKFKFPVPKFVSIIKITFNYLHFSISLNFRFIIITFWFIPYIAFNCYSPLFTFKLTNFKNHLIINFKSQFSSINHHSISFKFLFPFPNSLFIPSYSFNCYLFSNSLDFHFLIINFLFIPNSAFNYYCHLSIFKLINFITLLILILLSSKNLN